MAKELIKINKGMKYRLDPTTEQSITFRQWAGCNRVVWNLLHLGNPLTEEKIESLEREYGYSKDEILEEYNYFKKHERYTHVFN